LAREVAGLVDGGHRQRAETLLVGPATLAFLGRQVGPFEHPRPAAGLGHDQGQAAAITVVAGREGVQGLFVQKLDLHLVFQCGSRWTSENRNVVWSCQPQGQIKVKCVEYRQAPSRTVRQRQKQKNPYFHRGSEQLMVKDGA
jgi:hypothetical protein